MSGRLPLGAKALFVLLAAAVVVAVVVVRARTPDLVLEVTAWEPCTRTFAPSGIGDLDRRVKVSFFVRESDPDATVRIVDAAEATVRTLGRDVDLTEGEEVRYVWDGRTDTGDRAPPGRYRLGVDLPGADREMIWPRRIGLGTPPSSAPCDEPL